MINIAIRATYYICCCRNKNWDSPDFILFLLLFFFFFFLIIQSQAAFVNCLYQEPITYRLLLYVVRFTIVHSKTQIKFPLLQLSWTKPWSSRQSANFRVNSGKRRVGNRQLCFRVKFSEIIQIWMRSSHEGIGAWEAGNLLGTLCYSLHGRIAASCRQRYLILHI